MFVVYQKSDVRYVDERNFWIGLYGCCWVVAMEYWNTYQN